MEGQNTDDNKDVVVEEGEVDNEAVAAADEAEEFADEADKVMAQATEAPVSIYELENTGGGGETYNGEGLT